MFKKLKIGTKITSILLAVALISVVTISFLAYNLYQKSLNDKYFNTLSTINQLKADKIGEYFEEAKNNAEHISELDVVKHNLGLYTQSADSVRDSVKQVVQTSLENDMSAFAQHYHLGAVIITDQEGLILYNSSSANPDQSPGNYLQDPDGQLLKKAKDESYISRVFMDQKEPEVEMAMPLVDDYNNKAGILCLKLSMAPIYKITADTTGLGETGETLLTNLDEKNAVFISPTRLDSNKLMTSVLIGNEKDVALQMAAQGKTGAAQDIDYENNEVLAAWNTVPLTQWGIVTKINNDEVMQEANLLLSRFALSGLILLVISFLISIVFSRILVRPIVALKSNLNLLGKGVLPNEVQKQSNDEIGEIASVMNNFVQNLKNTATFAKQIGNGKYDAEYKPMSEEDTLGTALINMRDSIQEAEIRDKERNWIVTGVAEIGEILRSNDNLEQLGDEILSFVTEKIGAIQGAFYVVNDDDPEDIFIEMKASYAYRKKKYLQARFKFAEGLVGQSAIEQDTLLRTEIPDQYVTITSGLLGEKRPKCLLLVPLITDEKVYGVLEFASLEKFDKSQIRFVEEISLIIARTVFNIKVNERTRKLLEESQAMSQELQEQQEVLRQNAEEMEATQEELKRTNQRLEDQIEEVNRTQKRMQLLLENASEVITIYEEDGKVRYISPSVEKILGYSQTDMIGLQDVANVHPEGKEAYEQMFKNLIASPEEQMTLQYQYKRKDGDYVWLEATGTNLLDDPAIQGLIVNTRDITERRRAEQEERMRSKMQALSENSPDLITRIDNEGTFFYINPMIETYTGRKPDELIHKRVNEVDIEPKIVQEWISLLDRIKSTQEKINEEIDFPSAMGERVMQVNAIPEFDEEDALESVLVVSHDITDRKMIELEIANKNKKITESINYARRIQGAILPDNRIISQDLKDSFILYKAKDVVSGDFPWYLKVGDDIFIAAVDCTGHGVPGALISLIGYFLLNDIVRSQKIGEPGVILDKLDEGVTQTLRQDREDSTTKDGMDIALCKINLKKNELEFAGAHRPLYYLKQGELEEIKGNKFAIGGGIYRNQTNFTNHKIKLKEGDAVFFCSDGFPDQFGGPDNRKFGPKRLRELIREHGKLPMRDIYTQIDDAWEGWRGDQKQTDDMLLIGIRF